MTHIYPLTNQLTKITLIILLFQKLLFCLQFLYHVLTIKTYRSSILITQPIPYKRLLFLSLTSFKSLRILLLFLQLIYWVLLRWLCLLHSCYWCSCNRGDDTHVPFFIKLINLRMKERSIIDSWCFCALYPATIVPRSHCRLVLTFRYNTLCIQWLRISFNNFEQFNLFITQSCLLMLYFVGYRATYLHSLLYSFPQIPLKFLQYRHLIL